MSELVVPSSDIIPAKLWSTPERRDEIEQYVRTPLGAYNYEFDGGDQYKRFLAMGTLADGVVADMNKRLETYQVRAINLPNFGGESGTFQFGYILFGAPSREAAELWQPEFTDYANIALDGLGASFRLEKPSLPVQQG